MDPFHGLYDKERHGFAFWYGTVIHIIYALFAAYNIKIIGCFRIAILKNNYLYLTM